MIIYTAKLEMILPMNHIQIYLRKEQRIKRSFPLAVFFLFILAYGLAAQKITGSLEGRVLDPDGQALADVNIIINGENLQGTRGTTSDKKGYFRK